MDSGDLVIWKGEFGEASNVVANVASSSSSASASLSSLAAPSLQGLEEIDTPESHSSQSVLSKAYYEAFGAEATRLVSRAGYRPSFYASMLKLSSTLDADTELSETAADEAFAEWGALASMNG